MLSAANCDAVYYGDNIGYYDNCFDGPWPSGELDESQRDKVPRDDAIDYMKDHLSRVPVVVAGTGWSHVERVQARADRDRSTGRWRGAGVRPRGSGSSPSTCSLPFSVYGFVRLARRRLTDPPAARVAHHPDDRGGDHLRGHPLPRAGGGVDRGHRRDRDHGGSPRHFTGRALPDDGTREADEPAGTLAPR